MKDVIALLTSIYKDVKEQYKSIVSDIVASDLYDFMYVSKTNNENIVVVLTNQLSDSELAKYTDSLKDTGFSLSYNANVDDNGFPEKFISKKDGTVQEKTPLLTFHKASNGIDDFMNA